MKFKKIVDDFKVTSIYELKEIIDKDQREEEINKYIHTNEDVDLTDLYDLHYAYDKKIKLNGFYAIDGSNYINLLQSHQKEDEQKVEGYLKDFKDKYHLLFQTKKTKKLIIDPIEKMFFGDLICYKNFLKDLASKSLFISSSFIEIDNIMSSIKKSFLALVILLSSSRSNCSIAKSISYFSLSKSTSLATIIFLCSFTIYFVICIILIM